ncbi:MAG: TatD family hydrolase [Oligoflexia bacterium]|nr:TatD family hydrolase [Oligoflexia bacterium]
MWIDVHTHLEMIEQNTEDVLKQALIQKVNHMITIGCHPDDFEKVCTISEKYFPQVVATLGVHPHEAKFYSNEIEDKIKKLSKKPYVVGLGEMGLDYYYNHSDQNIQKEVFEKQIQLAIELNLPIEIHTRDAEADTMSILKKYKGKVNGLFHCFTGSQELCNFGLDLGFYISVSGVITFKNSENLRHVIKSVPLDRLFIETDAPFLAPVPMRGKKNEPAYVVHTAEKVAELKNVSLDELSSQLKKNVKTLFTRWAL